MIIGDCPYDDCDGHVWEPIGQAGAWRPHPCETCHRMMWTYHSRIEPLSLTDAAFREKFLVDEQTHTIREREPQP